VSSTRHGFTVNSDNPPAPGPAGQTQPLVSTLNAPTGTITANAAIVPAGANGDLSVFVTNDSDLIIDVNGYFAQPCR
jgi:hypothetical protein